MIVDAVLELARTEPQSRFTFKSLGEVLDVNPTAMYRHFRNRDAILRAALDRLFSMAVPKKQPLRTRPWTGGPAWSATSTP